MAKTCSLKDYVNEKGEFYEQPPVLLQAFEPAEYVAEQILNHLRYGYQMVSLHPLSAGNWAGRVLILFTKAQQAPQQAPGYQAPPQQNLPGW